VAGARGPKLELQLWVERERGQQQRQLEQPAGQFRGRALERLGDDDSHVRGRRGAHEFEIDLLVVPADRLWIHVHGRKRLLTVSGDTAALSTTPEASSIDSDAGTELLSISSATLTTSDGHHMVGQFMGTDTLGATTCSVDASLTLTR
jgi:hypothetical protein